MGYDIHGWVEVKPPWHGRAKVERWDGVIKIDHLIPRNYDPFACLFGVGNLAHFRPIAAGRGIPPDVSEDAERDYLAWFDDIETEVVEQKNSDDQKRSSDNSIGGESWVAWSELQQVDWGEQAEAVDDRIHWYERAADGTLIYKGKASYDRTFAQHVGLGVAEMMDNPLPYPEGTEWEIGERIYRVERMSRREALTNEWQLLFSLMESLARHYGGEGVRIVVWFDG